MTSSIVESLIPATFRGIPFGVNAVATKSARRTAVHEYPFRESVWAEDLGGGINTFAFSGFFADNAGGMLAMLERDAFLLAVKQPGPGIMSHPTLGIFQVSVLSFSVVESKDALGAFTFDIEFCETSSGPEFPSIGVSGAGSINLASLNVLSAGGSDFARSAILYAGLGAAVLATAPSVLRAWSALPASLSSTAQSVMGSVVGLGDGWGRYADGNASVAAPAGSTPATLVATSLANQSAMQTTIATSLASAASGAPAAVSAAAVAISAAVLASAADPADQVNLLTPMAAITVTASAVGGVIGDGITGITTAAAALCRTCALGQMAQAILSYRLTSYDQAIALRQKMADLFNAELLSASADTRDDTFAALRDLRSAVVDFLSAQAATLPATEVVTLPAPVPSLAIAQRLYNDATRTADLIARSDVIHPAFMPVQFTALAI